jgi:hypothetical protein
VNRSAPEIVSAFSEEEFSHCEYCSSDTSKAVQVRPALIAVLPHGANFTCYYQGVSHAEWPKNNDEYAPTQFGEAICQPREAVDTECRPT